MGNSDFQPKVSVIVAVYNAEKYIEKCLRSLFEQTLDDIEYIFIDDCTPDRSFEILDCVLSEYPNRRPQVKIIRNDHNLGVGQTRQKGIDSASGAYIIHCDPDDWIDKNLYEAMWNCAVDSCADIVISDYVYEWENYSRHISQHCPEGREEIFHDIVYGKLHCSFCNKLVVSDLAKRFIIEPGINMWEDVSVFPFVVFNASSVEHIEGVYYHYRINESSIVHSVNSGLVESQIKCVNSIVNGLKQKDYIGEINKLDLEYFHWYAIEPFIESENPEYYELWNGVFKDEVKNYRNFSISRFRKLRTRLALGKHYGLLRNVNIFRRHYLSFRHYIKEKIVNKV